MFIAKNTTTMAYIDANSANVIDKYECPGCGEPVHLKKGNIKIAHYAHKQFGQCHVSTEGESATHLQGKLALFQYFNDRYDEVKLEPWLSEIKQRPDLMVRKGTAWTVIEFQCAPITIERIRERMAGYRQLQLQVIWILGEPYQKKRIQSSTMAKFATLHRKELKIFFWHAQEGIYYKAWWQIDHRKPVNRHKKVDNQVQQLFKIQQAIIQARPQVYAIQKQLYAQNRNVVGIPWICHPAYSLPGGLKIPQWQVTVRIIMLLEHKPITIDEMYQQLFAQEWHDFGCLKLPDVQKLWLDRFLNDAIKLKKIKFINGRFQLAGTINWFDNYHDKLNAFQENR